jgi:hypothetical protein
MLLRNMIFRLTIRRDLLQLEVLRFHLFVFIWLYPPYR